MPDQRRVLRAFLAMAAVLLPLSGSAFTGVGPFEPVGREDRLDGDSIALLVLGDWGKGDELQQAVAQSLLSAFEKDGAAAVLLLGDNFLPHGVRSAQDPQWKTKFEAMYPAERIAIPFCPAVGNHDYQGKPKAEVEYTGTMVNGAPTRWNMPDFTWSRVFSSKDEKVRVRVIALNTVELVESPVEDPAVQKQLAWLDSELAKSCRAGESWRLVIAHHPVYSNGKHGSDKKLGDLLNERFFAGQVDAYITGHDHHFELFQPKNGVGYIVSGASGPWRKAKSQPDSFVIPKVSGFGWLQLSENELLIRFIDRDGKVLGAWKAPKRAEPAQTSETRRNARLSERPPFPVERTEGPQRDQRDPKD